MGKMEFFGFWKLINYREPVPDSLFGQGRLHSQLFFRHRMDELHFSCKKGDSSVGVAALSSIFQVAFDRHPDFGELTANLVVPSCEQPHLHKGIPVPHPDHPVVEDGFF